MELMLQNFIYQLPYNHHF